MGFNGFQWIALVFTWCNGFHKVLLVFNGLYWVLVDFNGFYWVSIVFKGFDWVFMGCPEFQ